MFQYPRKRFSDGGIEVSMVAFQAVDPGSIPGHRKIKILMEFGLVFLKKSNRAYQGSNLESSAFHH